MTTSATKYEYYLARDLIDMALEYAQDKNILEYVSSVCFNLDMAFESTDSGIPWHEVFNILDKWTFSKNINEQTLVKDRGKLEEIRNTCQQKIESQSKDLISST